MDIMQKLSNVQHRVTCNHVTIIGSLLIWQYWLTFIQPAVGQLQWSPQHWI